MAARIFSCRHNHPLGGARSAVKGEISATRSDRSSWTIVEQGNVQRAFHLGCQSGQQAPSPPGPVSRWRSPPVLLEVKIAP